MNIHFEKAPDGELKQKPEPNEVLGFGKIFTDYMFTMRYHKDKGWFEPTIRKYENLSLPPSTIVFHYAQEIFEGMKGYRRADGAFGLFRPDRNFQRFNNSAERMCMPTIPPEDQEQALIELLRVETPWFPDMKSGTMYIRPTMIATDEELGVKESATYLYFIILSPSGYYFSSGAKPVRVLAEDMYVRAAMGGVGTAKTGGNYAASLLAGKKARDKGCNQVLWLDAEKKEYIEEVGAMNICFVYDNKTIVTSSLDGTILEGVTRDSVLKMAEHLGYTIEERKISIHEVIDAISSGKLTESFGCGTAAVITPVGEILYKEKLYKVGNETGPIAEKLYDEITGIQWGIKEDIFGWTKIID